MKPQRAQEILNSKDHVDVFYKEHSVWIENVDTNHDSADITMLDTKARLSVPIWDLAEE